MTLTGVAPSARVAPLPTDHLVGRVRGELPGPTFVVTTGMHGNEPAGLHAARRVLESLQRSVPPLRGELVVLACNLGALQAGRRFLDRDLNRHWTDGDVRSLLGRDPATDGAEDREQRALAEIFQQLGEHSEGPVTFLDMHSTSSPSAPFLVMSDTLRNRRIAQAQPLPVILGLEEALDGTVMGFLTERGHVALAIEGGRHDALATVSNLESALWLGLVANGNVDAERVPDGREHRRRLDEAGAGLPTFLEIIRRHGVRPGDGFQMEPGYWSFQSVRRHQHLANDRSGALRAERDALILMPLYQEQGEDGFFLAQPVPRWRLQLSSWLRRLRLERVLGLLPGIWRHPSAEDTYWIAKAPGYTWVKATLAFFGYRRSWEEGGRLVMTRRRPGYKGLDPLL